MGRNNKIEISIVMPALNEERSIGICIEKALKTLKANKIKNFEIIVADNGSTDRTREIAKKMGAKVLIEEKKGYGNAYIKGLNAAQGKYIVIGDSDDSYDWTDIMRFIKPLKEENYDMVIGTRFKTGKIEKKAMPWHHKYIGNPLLSGILNLFFKTGVTDAHCGMRSFTKEAYRKMNLQMPGMEFATEMVIKAARVGLKIKEIPITLHRDARGGKKSHLKSFSDGWRHLRLMLLFSPNWLFIIPGILFLFLGALFFVWVQISFPVFGHPLGSHFSALALFFFMFGIQIIILGIYAKTYSFYENLDIHDNFIKKFLNIFTVNRGISIGIVLVVAGFIIDLLIIIEWIKKNFGALSRINSVLFATCLMITGFQIIFSSFFIGLIKMNKEHKL